MTEAIETAALSRSFHPESTPGWIFDKRKGFSQIIQGIG
jgi:hypothetical protein